MHPNCHRLCPKTFSLIQAFGLRLFGTDLATFLVDFLVDFTFVLFVGFLAALPTAFLAPPFLAAPSRRTFRRVEDEEAAELLGGPAAPDTSADETTSDGTAS